MVTDAADLKVLDTGDGIAVNFDYADIIDVAGSIGIVNEVDEV